MKKIIQMFFLILLIVFLNKNIYSQSLSEIENRFINMSSIIERETIKLDSLKKLLDERGKTINQEKKKGNPDRAVIINLMASSVTLSNKVDEQQKKLARLTKEFTSLKEQLNKMYLSILDSLKAEKKTNNEIEAEILLYTEKKLLTSPKIPQLSFYPNKILELDLKKAKTNHERKLYKEYIENALNEINSLLTDVNELDSEIGEVLTLQKKMSRFLEETEFEDGIKQHRLQAMQTPVTTSSRFTEGDAVFNTQAEAYVLLLSQLNLNTAAETTKKLNLFDNQKNLNLKEYKNLLEEVKKRLKEYKLVLNNKIIK